MRRSLLLFPLALALLLAAPAVATAGGFATAGLSSTPDGVVPGQPWQVDITVLQHGRTPLEGIAPRVQISSGATTREFAAAPTGRPGVYSAEVVFPSAGRWDYQVLDGFNDELPHAFPAVQIGDVVASPAAPSRPDDGGIAAGWLWGAAAALALALAVLAADRLRRRPARAARGRARVRVATVVAAMLACAAAAMAAAAVTAGGEEERAGSAQAPAAARDGKAVWAAAGCGSCHTFAPASATGQFGPNLAASLTGVPASYIRESIVAPSRVAAAGYSTGMMPEDYAARMAPDELERLVDFIRSGVPD